MSPELPLTDAIGYVAAFLTTIAFVPQTLKVVRERQTAAISLHMYLLFVAGLVCWLAYGFMMESLPIILANSVTLVLAAVVLLMKLRHG